MQSQVSSNGSAFSCNAQKYFQIIRGGRNLAPSNLIGTLPLTISHTTGDNRVTRGPSVFNAVKRQRITKWVEKWKTDESRSLHTEVKIAPNVPVEFGIIVAPLRTTFEREDLMYSKKMARFLAVSAIAFFLGATSAHAQVFVDVDQDNVADDVDECLPSDFSQTVVINGVDTGIQNTAANAVGCTLADLINDSIDTCFDNATNHGKFVSCVSHEMNILKRARTISGSQKGKIQSIVAKMR